MTRAMCRGKPAGCVLDFGRRPLQAGLGGCPWRVAVASILLCRTRKVCVAPMLKGFFARWPTAGDLARSDTEELEAVLQPLGLQRRRARQLQRFSVRYLGDSWEELTDLPGVGAYVRDAVGLVCFGLTDVACGDKALLEYVECCQSSTTVT